MGKKKLKKKHKKVFRIISICLLIIVFILRVFFVNRFIITTSYLILVIAVGLYWIFDIYLTGELDE
jgi:hypothetical protein